MRENMGLFRGKRLDNGEWVEGSFLQDGEAHRLARQEELPFSDCYIVPKTERDNVRMYLTQGICLDIHAHHVDPATVGQYTGLKDKNGKRIFEGDLCDMSILGEDHTLQKIVIRNGAVGFEPTHPDEVHPDDRDWKSFWRSEEGEMWNQEYFAVIGNIHDDPELLRDAENKCDTCLNSRPVVSENGIHRICCLSSKAAMNCLLGKKDMHMSLRKGGVDKQ